MVNVDIGGFFRVRILHKDEIIFEQEFHNGIVDEGKNLLLDTMFNSASQSNWYVGIIETITVLSNDDTMSSHTGWTEYTAVDESTRQQWIVESGGANSRSIQNDAANYVEYTVNDATAPTLDGIFVTSDNTLSGTSGYLWSTGAFTNPPTVVDGEIVQIQYIVTVN